MQRLGVPGEDLFIGKGVSYYAKRDLNQFAGKKVLVVGGGNTTAKSALLTKTLASEVILVHRRDTLRTYPMLTKKLEKEGIQVWYNTELKELKGNGHVEVAVLVNNKTQNENRLTIDWVVICVGTEPDQRLAQGAGLEMVGKYVIVNPKMMTSRPGIFACGEITGGKRHLITAAGEGASTGMFVSEYLALEMLKRHDTFKGAKNGKYADEYLAILR
jgi:thioredoxin reductase (NADPH)